MSTRKNIRAFIEEQHMYVSLGEIRADFDSAISLMEMEEEKRYTRELKEKISHLEAALAEKVSIIKECNEKKCSMEREIGTITAKAISLNEECDNLKKLNHELNKKNRGVAETLDSIRTLLRNPQNKEERQERQETPIADADTHHAFRAALARQSV